jgi:hypothetical protein
MRENDIKKSKEMKGGKQVKVREDETVKEKMM